MASDSVLRLRGGCVALWGRGLLITGASGMGKSALALDLMATGAGLVSDDWTELTRSGDVLVADAPPSIRGQIEARGIGILAASPVGPVPLVLVVELDDQGDQRLPALHKIDIAGTSLPLVKAKYTHHLGAALRQSLIGGRIA